MNNDFNIRVGVEPSINQQEVQNKIDKQTKNIKVNTEVNINTQKYSKAIAQYYKDLEKQQDAFNQKNLSGYDLEIKKSQEQSRLFSNQIKSQMQERISAENKVRAQIKNTAKAQQDAVNLQTGKTQLSNNISSWLNNNTKAGTELRNELIRIQTEIKDTDAVGLNNLKKQFSNIKSEANALGQTGDSVFTKLSKNIHNFAGFLGAATITMQAIRTVQNMITEVKNLDAAIVDLQMATGSSYDEVSKLMSTYIEMGKQLGATASEVASAASDYLRQGKSIAETNQLITDSLVLSKLGNISSADATTYLTTAMKGYKVEVEDVIGIVDKLSAIDLVSATDAGGLAEGMAQVATNADLAGISMDKLLGYIAVIGETTGESMSSVGTGLNAIFSRMGNIKLSRLKDYETGESLSDVETVLNGLDVKLRDSNDTFRNFGDVLDEVGGKWGSYSEVQQRALAKAFSGTNHMEEFLVLMSNYDTAIGYTETAVDSSGTAMEKFGYYTESVEAKANKLKASFQGLANTTIDSSWVKGFLDISNVVVQAIDSVGGLVPVILAVGGAIGITKLSMKTLLLDTEKQTVANLASTVSQYGLATSIGAVGTAIKTFLLTNPVGIILTIGTAVLSVTKIVDACTTSIAEQTETVNKAKESYESAQSELDSISTELENQTALMDSLLAKENLTYAEKDELQNLKDITAELLLQQDIADKKEKIKQKNLAEESSNLVNSKYDTTISDSAVLERIQYAQTGGNYVGLISDTGDLPSLIAGFREFTRMKEEALNTEDAESFNESLEVTRDILLNSVEDLQTQKANIEDYYKTIDPSNMTESQREIYDTYKSISNSIKQIYSELDPNKWNSIAMTDIFNTKGLEKTKEELISMAKDGTLGEDTISSYKNLNNVLKNSGLILEDGQTYAQAFIRELKGLGDVSQDVIPGTISETVNGADESSDNKFAYVDKVMTAVDKLNEAKQKLSSGKLDTSGVYDLIKEFPTLAQYVDITSESFGDLANGLNEVSQINLDNITFHLEAMLANAGDETTRQQIQAMIDIINQLSATASSGKYNIKFGIDITSPETITSRVDSILSSIKSAQEEIKEHSSLSSKSLSSLYDAFSNDSDATKALDQFSVGLISLSDLSSILTKKGDEVKDAWSEAMQANQESSTSFYNNVIKQDSELVKTLLENYNINMDDFSTVQELKAGIYSDFGIDLSALTADQINDLANKYGIDVKNFQSAQNEKLKMLRDQINVMTKINADTSKQSLWNVNNPVTDKISADSKIILDKVNEEYNKEVKKEQDKLNEALSALDKVEDATNKYTPEYVSGSGSSSKSKGAKSSKNKFSQVFDWIEVKIENLKTKAQNAIDSIVNYTTAKSKNAKIDIAVKAKTDVKSRLESAQKTYNKKANSVGLSKKYQDLVDNGGLKIETITNEKLADKIEEYTKWRDAAKEVGEEISAIKAEIKELNLQKLDNITSYWDSKNSTTEARISNKDSAISLKEAQGKNVTKADYTYQINRQKTLKANAKAEYNEYNKQFQDLIKSGDIKYGDENWKNATTYLLKLKGEINDVDAAIVDLNKSINNLAIEKLENKLKTLDSTKQKIEDSISLKVANGGTGSISDYNSLITNNKKVISNLQDQNKEYARQQQELLKNGVKKTDQGYIELQEKIDANLSSISACKVEQAGWNAEIRNIKWEWLDTSISKMDTVKNQLSTLSSLIRGDLVDDNGSYTNAGLTQLGLYAQQLSSARDEVALYEKAISNLKKELASGEISQSVYDEEMANYLSLQNQAILSTKEYEDAILDLKKNAIEAETEAFRKLIQARKDELAAQKESDDYNKSVQDKQKSIDILNKQIAVLKLSTDRKDIAQRLELEQQLNDKLEELSELQADHDYDTKQDALDDELNSYEKSQDDKLDALENNLSAQEQAIKESLSIVTSNYDTVLSNINSLADEYGMNLTNSITSPWESAINAAQLYKDLVAGISANGILSDNVSAGVGSNISNGSTSNSVKSNISSLLAKANGQGDGTSALNKYIQGIKNPTTGKNYGQISYDQMAELASILGISGVTAESIKGDTATKNKILSALKLAGFSDGGYVGEINKVISGNGDTGIATVRTDELILDPNQSKLFKELVGGLPILNPVLKSLPNLSGISQKTNDINVHYDTLMNVEGNIDKSIDVENMIDAAFTKNQAELMRLIKR